MKDCQARRLKQHSLAADFRRVLRQTEIPLLAGGIIFALAACGSTKPMKYYDISYPPIGASSQETINASLLVQRFAGSDLYRDSRIIYGSSGPELGAYQTNLWAEPPVELLRDAMVRGLRSSGRFRSVMTYRSNSQGDFLVTGHLYEFREVDGSPIVARLVFDMELRDVKSTKTIWKLAYNHDEPVSEKSVNAVVDAMSRNVQRSVQEAEAGIQQMLATYVAK
jgi:ABC-type uncharacterized transport system auxiliary subunit